MFFYEVGYGSYEDSGFVQLVHERAFSGEEFEEMILDLAPEAFREELHQVDPRDHDIRIGPYYLNVGFDQLYERVATLLVERHGFERVVFQATYSVFGWPSLIDTSRWQSDRDEQMERLTERLRSAGFTLERYPSRDSRPVKTWDELSEETRATYIEHGYDEHVWADKWNDSIPEDEKRKPAPGARQARPKRRSRRSGSSDEV